MRDGLAIIILKYTMLNIGAYFLANYDKLLGAVFTILSIVYVSFKLWHDYLKKK